MITKENENKNVNLKALQAYHNNLMEFLKEEGLVRRTPHICSQCGAPLFGNICGYCGSRFK